jgi:hypothetical protein
MDTFEYMDPFDRYIHKKEIYLDDIPVDSLLYRDVKRTGPTPADIVLLWKKGYYLTPAKEKILVTVLVNDILIASEVNMVDEAESVLNRALKRIGNDPEAAIRLLIALINLHYRRDEEKSTDYYIKARLLRSESDIKLDKMTENKWKIIRSRMDNI